MFGIDELKNKLVVAQDFVECPVKGCIEKVSRQKQQFIKDEKFKCPKHNIYISPTTFEYETELENILWKDKEDIARINSIKKVKRESRIARENSEDAVTWNVFRYLEKNDIPTKFLSSVSGQNLNFSELILWSYSSKQNDSWDLLNKARKEFGEKEKRGSEPDIIVLTDSALFFIEAKVLAGNDTSGTGATLKRHLEETKNYIDGRDNWFGKVFCSEYRSIVTDQKYELMRFWLLGTWLANQLKLPFYLFNLVLTNREKEIEKEFGKHIIQDKKKSFKRICWEEIYEFICKLDAGNKDAEIIKNYFKNKALGYNSNNELIRAFNI